MTYIVDSPDDTGHTPAVVEVPEPTPSPIKGEGVPYGEISMEYRSEERPIGERLELVFEGDETPQVKVINVFQVGSAFRWEYVLIWGAGRHHG